MKKILSIAITGIIFSLSLQAQNETDALRYSQSFPGGTARSIGMGGAFGALGGDFSSLSLNPAGIGVYRSTELSFTPTIVVNNTSTSYLGGTREDDRYKLAVSNLGYISTRQTGNETGWVSMTFGLGYNRLNDFHRNTLMSGIMLYNDAGSSSFLDNFTNYANEGIWSEYYEELAWQTYGIDWDTLNGEYWNYPREYGYGQSQTRRIQEEGGTGEYTFSFGANYNDKLYLGGTFGIQRMNYTYSMEHVEKDDEDLIFDFQSFTFGETLRESGTGYTFKAGLIYRPISLIRLGAAMHVPTFYRINRDSETEMQTHFDNNDEYYAQSDINAFDYMLQTPFKVIGSVAVQLPKLAIVSLDYEWLDYTRASFDSKGNDFDLLEMNDRIDEVFKVAHNLKIGAEVHLGPMYLRGGFACYGSPYKSGEVNANLKNLIYSGGVGFRSEHVFFDMAYSVRNDEYSHYLYLPENLNAATTTENMGQIAATLGFRL